MIDTEQLLRLAGGNAYATAAIALIAVTSAWLTIRTIRKSAGNPPPAAVLVAALAAAACTAYSADTSWRFAADHLGMATTAERATMFAAAELALFAVALMARQNLATQQSPGTPGVLVWIITGVQVIPAFAESGAVGGFVRAFVGPVLAALLWHLAMGIELRHAKPGANSQSLLSILARELRERIMSRLGLAVRDRTAEQITRDRWTVKSVALAARLSELADAAAGGWLKSRRIQRTSHRLSVAVGKAQAGAHPEQRRMLLELLAARRHSTALATMPLASPWTLPDAAVQMLPDGSELAPDTAVRTAPGHAPLAMSGHAPKAVSDTPDIVSAARSGQGADTPLTSPDTVRPAPVRTTPDTEPDSPADSRPDNAEPSVSAIIRRVLDRGIEDPDTILSEVRKVHPDAKADTVRRTTQRQRNSYL